jgi:hypothetical protein
MASPLNHVVVPIVTYEYLFCLLSSEWLRPPTRHKAQGLLSGSCTPSTVGHGLRTKKSGYDLVPSSEKRLGNQVPHTEYGSTTPG